MRADSFKDILAQFLETNQASELEIQSSKDSNSPSQIADIPFVFLDTTLSVPRSKVAAYGSTRKVPKKSKPQISIRRERLSLEGHTALDCILRLGALDLESGLNESHVKKAYRRLLKFYHPDHYPLDLAIEERRLRTEQFLELQTAFKTLQNEVKLAL